MEYKANTQAKNIIELKSSVDGHTFLTKATDYAAITGTTGGTDKDLKELRAMMKQLTASTTAQDATLAALSTKTTSDDGGGSGQNTNKKKRVQACMCTRSPKGKYIIRMASDWS